MIGLGIVGRFSSEEMISPFYRIDRICWIGWIVWLDRIVLIVSAGSSGFYCLDIIGWMVSARLY